MLKNHRAYHVIASTHVKTWKLRAVLESYHIFSSCTWSARALFQVLKSRKETSYRVDSSFTKQQFVIINQLSLLTNYT